MMRFTLEDSTKIKILNLVLKNIYIYMETIKIELRLKLVLAQFKFRPERLISQAGKAF